MVASGARVAGSAGSRRRIPDLTTHRDAMSRQSGFPWQAVAFTAVAVVCMVSVVSGLDAQAPTSELDFGVHRFTQRRLLQFGVPRGGTPAPDPVVADPPEPAPAPAEPAPAPAPAAAEPVAEPVAAPAEAPAPTAAPVAGDVVFPDDYPNSVKHMLLIATLGMLIGAGVLIFLQMSLSTPPVSHSLCFLACAISGMGYFAMWTGLGTVYKTTDITPRVIFLPRYIDWLLTQPLILAALCQISKADVTVLVSLIGNDVLMILALMIGAICHAPFKYMWWFAGVIFLINIIVILIQRLDGQNNVYKICSYIIIACNCIYVLAWVLGSEGTASLGLTQEVALLALTDLVALLGFSLYFLFNYKDAMGEEGEESEGLKDGEDNQQSQQFV